MFKKPHFLILLAGLSAGCATTTLRSVERSPDLHTATIHKVLVVCVTSTPGLRSIVEGEYVWEWKKRGVDAFASAEMLPAGVLLDKAGIAPFAKEQHFDAVMVTRLLKREQLTAQTPEHANLTQDVQEIGASPEYGMNYEVAVVSSNLYDTATEKRVWSGVSQTIVTGDTADRIRAYVKLILKNLYDSKSVLDDREK